MEIVDLARKQKSRFGAEPRLATWLMFNKEVGEVFTIRELRSVLSNGDGPNTDEHFNRRFRELRHFDWIVHSSRNAHDLKQDEYRLKRKGHPIWLGKSHFKKKAISAKMRREVFGRDGHPAIASNHTPPKISAPMFLPSLTRATLRELM